MATRKSPEPSLVVEIMWGRFLAAVLAITKRRYLQRQKQMGGVLRLCHLITANAPPATIWAGPGSGFSLA
jgi:hypothetical protein